MRVASGPYWPLRKPHPGSREAAVRIVAKAGRNG